MAGGGSDHSPSTTASYNAKIHLAPKESFDQNPKIKANQVGAVSPSRVHVCLYVCLYVCMYHFGFACTQKSAQCVMRGSERPKACTEAESTHPSVLSGNSKAAKSVSVAGSRSSRAPAVPQVQCIMSYRQG